MRIILPFVYQQLKQLVLDKAGLTTITPSDCKSLSLAIAKTTKNQISDTTLKRIYGFALSSSLPSHYTLNLLAIYCGYVSWDDFCDRHSKKTATPPGTVDVKVDTLFDTITKTTYKTLQALKNKSVIPYNLTIEREFINEHLDLFMEGEYKATVLASPAGYGKTVALCHWVERRLNENLAGKNDDQILFLNGKVLAGLSPGVTIVDWMLALMGMPSGGNLEILKDHVIGASNFYLIIDEFDTTVFKPEQLDLLFNILLDLIGFGSALPQFKVILTMRTASWMPIHKRLQINNRLHDWFLGFVDEAYVEKNVPLLTTSEIRALCRHINPCVNVPEYLHPEVAAFFSYPLFFQYYYQKNHTDFFLDELDHFRIYEVISSYCYDKLYTGRFSTEKVLLIKNLLQLGSYLNGVFLIDKLKAYDQIKAYRDAYLDLLNIGFLREYNRSGEIQYEECIEFPNKRLFAALMARKLTHDAGGFNEQLCIILTSTVPVEYRLYILKWCIFNAVKIDQYEIFAHLDKVDLSASDKAKLVSFLSSLIKRNFLLPSELRNEANIFDNKRKDIFHYFFGFELLSAEYEQALKDLLKVNLGDNLKIWVNTCLGINGIVQLNPEAIENSIRALKQFPDEAYELFDINPLYCIETIYHYFKTGSVNKKALMQITDFMFRDNNQINVNRTIGSNKILYLLALSTLYLAGNYKKSIRFISKLKQLDKMSAQSDPSFNFFLDIGLSQIYIVNGKAEQGMLIYQKLTDDYKAGHQNYTPYMRTLLDYLSVVVLGWVTNNERGKRVIENAAYSTDKPTYPLMEINLISTYLQSQNFDRSTQINTAVYMKFKKQLHCNAFQFQYYLFNYSEIAKIL